MATKVGTIMLPGANGSIERVIHGVKVHEPNRFSPEGENWSEDYPDLTGWAWIAGKRIPVETGYRAEVMVWEIESGYDYDDDILYAS